MPVRSCDTVTTPSPGTLAMPRHVSLCAAMVATHTPSRHTRTVPSFPPESSEPSSSSARHCTGPCCASSTCRERRGEAATCVCVDDSALSRKHHDDLTTMWCAWWCRRVLTHAAFQKASNAEQVPTLEHAPSCHTRIVPSRAAEKSSPVAPTATAVTWYWWPDNVAVRPAVVVSQIPSVVSREPVCTVGRG